MTSSRTANKSNTEYMRLLEKLNDIPTLPAVPMRVNELINDPTSSSGDIAEVLKRDQVLTAKILRLVNSSYYSIPGGVNDVQRALAFLGFNTVAQLVLGISVFNQFKGVDLETFSMSGFWKHALATAVCAELIAKKLKYPKPEEIFTCGLLHDIGKLVLHEVDAERFGQVVNETHKRGVSFSEIEREWDLPTHPFLGEAIATRWGLPQIIRQVIRYHHQDVSKMVTILASSKFAIQVVRLANAIVVNQKTGYSGDASDGGLNAELFTVLGWDESHLPQIANELANEMERAGALLNVYG